MTWEPLPPEERASTRRMRELLAPPWGLAPLLAVSSALALVVIAGGMSIARRGATWAEWPFWLGMVTIFMPAAARLLAEGVTRRERIALVAQLALALYVVKVLHSPTAFTFYDELLHWRTAVDILQTWRLYQPNPLLPVSPYYPGLENTTVALVQVTGLALLDSGILLLGVARLLFVLALYLFYERIGKSPRVAGVAVLVYMTNPAFVFFDKQFAYESLALPFAAVLLWALTWRARAHQEQRTVFLILSLSSLAAVIVTHHITAYALTAFLLLWAAVSELRRRRGGADEPGPGWLAIVALVGTLAWLFAVARITIPYLGGNFRSTLVEIFSLISGELSGRTLFTGFAGDVAPLWEQLTGLASMLLISLLLIPGLLSVRRKHSHQLLPVVMALTAPLYLASQVLRFSSFGLQISSRTPEFTFVPLGLVLALGIIEVGARYHRLGQRVALVLCLGVILTGGVILGWPRWARLPGPYLVSADSRSIEPQSMAAAEWTREVLGQNQHIAADRMNGLLMLAYGGQSPVTASFSGVDVPRVFLAAQVGPGEIEILRQGEIHYLVVDRRLSSGLPVGGVYWELGETGAGGHKRPISASILAKFDGLPSVHRIFDSGDIAIYDVRGLY